MVNDGKTGVTGLVPFGVGAEIREPAQVKRSVGYAIRRAQMRVYEDFFATLADLDATPSRFTLMALISENPGIRSVDLARALGVARSGMVRLIDDLESRNLLSRKTLRSDRRNQALTLTALGRRKLDQLEQAVERHEEQVTYGLTASERECLLDLLRRVAWPH